MDLSLQEITKENKDICIAIQSTEEQDAKKLTLSVEDALREASNLPDIARPFAIKNGDRIIGFTMFAFDEGIENPKDRYWLWQLKIDKKYQGMGYGQGIMPVIIRYFKEHGAKEITLSTKPDNDNALHIYKKLGFEENGEMNDGEVVLKLNLEDKFRLIKDYKTNAALRQSFNELANKTFGLDFEDWYQNGYWRECYIPYSIVYQDKIIANVSVNVLEFVINGVLKHYIQLGTVMTDEKYRGQGFIKMLMAEIEKDYNRKTDGYYLFANDSVLEFYPKFGFQKGKEYQCSKQVYSIKQRRIRQVPMQDKAAWDMLEKAIRRSVPQGRLEMTNNSGLILFYITKFMRENVYYDERQDVYVIAEIEDEELLIHNIFSEKQVDLDELIDTFGRGIKRVILGFTPECAEGYTISELREEDTTLFLKGNGFAEFQQQKVMFPTLTHA